MTTRRIGIVVYGLSENWLGGVNYFRNLVSVFDSATANEPELHLHVLTDAPAYFADLVLSSRVSLHSLTMLRKKSPAWALRKTMLALFKPDYLLIAELKRLKIQAVLFSHVPGAAAAGIRCLPWIPDFQFRHHPELFDPSTAAAEHERAQAWIRDSDGLIVSSQSALDDAVSLYGIEPARVRVLRFAPNLAQADVADPSMRDIVFARYGIDRPYVFLPNQYWRHKNHALAVRAIRSLVASGRSSPLVISTGKTADTRDPAYFAEFEAELAAAQVGEHYKVLGVINRQDMLILLAHSMAVLNPSRFEGWSSSVEEAKALGKPLLVSSIDVHLEQVAGWPDVGVFDVDDVMALADLLEDRQQASGSRIDAHPPKPQLQPYAEFARQYIALLRDVSDHSLALS